MKLLVDTHVLIWWWSVSDRLTTKVTAYLIDPGNEIFVSPVSAWEAATKVRIGQLDNFAFAISRFKELIAQHGFAVLPLTIDHGLMAGTFAAPHRDPFDRMLAAQSIVERMPIISVDTALDQFGCVRLWA